MAILKAGTRLRSAVCKTEIMIVAAPKDEVELLRNEITRLKAELEQMILPRFDVHHFPKQS